MSLFKVREIQNNGKIFISLIFLFSVESENLVYALWFDKQMTFYRNI